MKSRLKTSKNTKCVLISKITKTPQNSNFAQFENIHEIPYKIIQNDAIRAKINPTPCTHIKNANICYLQVYKTPLFVVLNASLPNSYLNPPASVTDAGGLMVRIQNGQKTP